MRLTSVQVQRLLLAAILAATGFPTIATAQHSVARQWNDALLNAIRRDRARPTVHARNLFHTSLAMYDAWAAYDDVATPVLLGKTRNGFTCPFFGIDRPSDAQAARDEAISYAAYRILTHRFRNSPGAARSLPEFNVLMQTLGHDATFTSTDYRSGSAAALGNYIAEQLIAYGLQDNSNEQDNYKSRYYKPVNPRLKPEVPGTSGIIDPNRWQEMALTRFIGQSRIVDTTAFITPEWGRVHPFALSEDHLTKHVRDGYEYWVYHDPGDPPYLDTLSVASSEQYRWTFELVAIWSSHLDPTDGVLWDISPASLGNIQNYPTTFAEHRDFYDRIGGGDIGAGHPLNPKTGLPYAPQVVPRGDYARVLAEFWADGPNSETPPGHWFTILNEVTDHPLFERRFEGKGGIVDPLEWDVKAYLALGGAVHDAGITAWGIKGWYDYLRPISAIRCMAEHGQSSDPNLPNYDPAGLSLIDGFIELVQAGDPLAGIGGQNIGKIKLRAWRGPQFLVYPDPLVRSGVGWILAENWWPYQLPTFVTPPFAGFISGHSTFSRAAAVVMERLTGDPFFPGGLGEFHATRNQYLEVEEGPSVDVTLQAATYRDASDQTSLSRIWTGFHPPADDMPGRLNGQVIGADAFQLAKQYFTGTAPAAALPAQTTRLYPNPVAPGALLTLEINRPTESLTIDLYDLGGRRVRSQVYPAASTQRFINVNVDPDAAGLYFLRTRGDTWESTHKVCVVK